MKRLHAKDRKRGHDYSSYIYKVLQDTLRANGHETMQISMKAMMIMNAFVSDMFMRIAREAGDLARYNNRSTISSKEIQTAVRLLLPGELARHAVSEGTKAITKFNASLEHDVLTPAARKRKEKAKMLKASVVS